MRCLIIVYIQGETGVQKVATCYLRKCTKVCNELVTAQVTTLLMVLNMRFILGRMRSLFIPVLVFVIVVFVVYKCAILIQIYGSLFFWETYVPSPPIPSQLRLWEDTPGLNEGDGAADLRSSRPRLLCMIITSPKYHSTRAVHVANTWARHCTRHVFLTSQHDPSLGETIMSPGQDTYDRLWYKVTSGFQWAYNNLEDIDWVVKLDDDTFLLVENLQEALKPYDPAKPQAMGMQLKTWEWDPPMSVYLSGGAGYVLSRGAVTLLAEKGLRDKECETEITVTKAEDVTMGRCLHHLGISLLNSLDEKGRQRFHVYPPLDVVDPRQELFWKHLWLRKISVHPYKFGIKDLSANPISFHYVDAETMYLMYYLVYVIKLSVPNIPSTLEKQEHQQQLET
ncbi:glycoprotein-N-acetylgalactosamine 3-beta-galactosyltransferase 1-like isoform X2 [Oratosquilla oratoria]|uniref:glycoprotein-N-acetylgalactosamine 3-beta-galactosyltransferase 1-like isoform X2 n=1 Tax=Oratosquilla oratoria TaxID=337810 RepID=UPI003F77781F